MHTTNPKIIDKRRKSQIKGGLARKSKIEPVEINSIADIKGILTDAINQLRASSGNPISRIRALGFISSIMLSCLESLEIEQRISRLESHYNELNK